MTQPIVTQPLRRRSRVIARLAGLFVAVALAGAVPDAAGQLVPGQLPPSQLPTAPSAPPINVPGEAPSRKAKEQQDKNKKPEKFGPISLFPLVQTGGVWLLGPPAGGPVTDGVLFIAPFKDNRIAAWTIADDTQKWLVSDLAAVQPLLIDAGRLYITLDGEMVALNTEDGKPLWRVPTGGPVSAVPIAKAGWLLIALDTGELKALRGETGETVWTAKFKSPIKTTPVIVGDRLYVAPQDNRLVAIDLPDGKQLWEETFEANVTAIGAQEHRVFAGTRLNFYALDHGGEIKWKRRIGAEVIGQPATDDSTVYTAYTDNTLLALDANNGGLRWREALTYRPVAGPVRADDTVLLTGLSPVLHGYTMKDGKAQPDFTLPVWDRTLIVGSPLFLRGPTFFGDKVIVAVAQGYMVTLGRQGPGVLSQFSDPGFVLPALTFPGEQPQTSAAVPPKS